MESAEGAGFTDNHLQNEVADGGFRRLRAAGGRRGEAVPLRLLRFFLGFRPAELRFGRHFRDFRPATQAHWGRKPP